MSEISPGEERQRRLEQKLRRAEGNLLFYVFAVQLGYVSAEQVMAASGAWAADPTRRFVDRLAFEGSLSGDKRKRLDAMVRDALEARSEPSVIDLHRGRPPAWETDARPAPEPRGQAETLLAPLAPLETIEGSDWASPLDPPTSEPLSDLGAPSGAGLLPPIGPDLGSPPLAPISPAHAETLREGGLADLGAPQSPLPDIGGADTAPAPASARRAGLMDIGAIADSMALSAGVSGIASLDAMTRDYADRITAEHPGRYTYRSLETDEETEDRTLAELGRGGIGRVLRAHDTHLGREVALKELLLNEEAGSRVPSPSGRSMSGAAARFLREARVTGQLEHPNIVPVYELGERPDGTFYYSMKLVRGRTLEDALAESETLDDRLRLLGHFSDVCQAIAYAHSRGVVHRDLKPQNIMVGEFGETLVLDWGLAKVRGKRDIRGGELRQEIRGMQDAPGNQTMVGSALGTPAYMSPEQAIGEVDQIDERSDVWGLGAILYEILTGKPPFGGATPFEIIGKVMKDPVVPVRERVAEAPADLAAVCEKALTRAKKKRYPSARELASEIVAWQGGARVGAYTYTSMDLLKRFASRNKLPLLTAGVGLALLIITLVAGFLEVRAERDVAEVERENAGLARDQAVVEQSRAALERDKARHHLAEVLGEKARSYAESNDAVLAEIYASAALGLGERPEARGVLATTWNAARPELAWQSPRGARCAALAVDPTRGSLICAETTGLGIVGWSLKGGVEQLHLGGHDGPVGALLLAPGDGVGARRLVSGGADGTVRLWNVGAGTQLARLEGHEGAVTGLALSGEGDGARLVSGGADGTVRVWDLGAGTEVQQLGAHAGGVRAVAALGGLAVSAGADGMLRAWAPGAEAATWEAAAHEGGVAALAVDPTHDLVASGGADGQVAARDGRTGELIGSFKAGEAGVSALAFSRAGLVVATADGAVRSWDPRSGTLVRALTALASPVIALVADGEGTLLAGSTEQGDVVTWDPASGEHAWRLEGLLGLADRVAFSADGSEVAVVGQRESVRVYDRATGRETARLYGGERPWVLGFSPVGRRIVVGTATGQALVWDLDLNREVVRIAAHKGVTISAAFGPRGERIVTGGSDQVVALWDATTGAALTSHTEHTGRVARALLSPDGRTIASGGHDSRVMVWDIETRTKTVELHGHSDWLRDLAWSPDGSRLVTASDDFSARVWDVASGKQLVGLEGHAGRVFGAVFAPGGELVITGSDDRTIRVWEAATGLEIARLIGHAREVRSVALAPDGMALASGDVGATMRLWNVPPQRVGRRFQGEAIVRALSLSPDATRLAAEGGDGEVRVWSAQSESVEAVLPGHGTMLEAVAFSPEGELLATGDHEGGLRMWQMPAGELLWENTTEARGITSITWSPDGERLWTARAEPRVQARSRATGEVLAEYTGHSKDVYALALSPDGKVMASAGTGRVIRLWSPQTLESLGTLDEPTRLVVDLAMTGDGGRLAATSFEGDVRLWDLERQALIRTIVGQGVRSHAVAFTPDDRLLAIAYADGRIEVVDVERGTSRMTLTGHHTYSPLAFFPDGSTLVSATLGNRLRLYAMAALDAKPELVLARAEEAFGVRLEGTRVEPDPALARTRLLPVPR